jgi:hypothetical protein
MTYQAVVTTISCAPHPNADRLQIGYINGARVIVGLETKSGDLGVYFEQDGQLSDEYCSANDLLPRYDDSGNRIGGGYFSDNRRVRAQNFRSVKSEGFWMPLESLSWTGFDISRLKVGDMFDTLNGKLICNKYYTKATLASMKAGSGKSKLKTYADFPEHYDTAQFRFIPVPDGALVHISEKEHGTSVRYGHVKVHRSKNKPLIWWTWHDIGQWIKDRTIAQDTTTAYEYVLGTRRAILPGDFVRGYTGGYYGNGDPYDVAATFLHGKLKQDEIVYGEVVGYLRTGKPLFSQGTSKLKDIQKQYGGEMVFSYGCVEGTARFKVYRITQGGRDLTWFEIKQRATELGVDTVSVIDSGVFNGNRDELNARVETHLEGPSTLDPTHIREGVCLRIESEFGIRIVKAKSWTFGVLEGYIKDDETYVDMEEIA